ncbi:MAG: biotin/lipoyl-containing protein [Anaerolineae bacterium]|jgi:biotin carboxyl carrier protein|uniref:biotin/lipoyl-containing protein n=1 Tax=Candidatus Amarolinea dominans TaxID=3140696 RepID=UPI001D8DF27E|nr:biotin/lipoyl-binding protein [Anaerolineae bacterium]MBK7199173.1 biotin/lipoyl-binding protein [Anaerolineae bacterium]MBK9095920.1 biotin/lipoyl-binding protein [Anaerolineae bacterium]MBK9229964.1 biotin/lipoyl-binding protein [Anaerolineae bacterium]
MKYIASVQSKDFLVEIDLDHHITVDGKPFDVDLKRIGTLPVFSLLLNKASHEVVAEELQGNTYRIMIGGEVLEVRVEDERWRRLNQARDLLAVQGGELQLKAPIPGLVVKVLVAEDEAVHAGQSLVILEAMKMENDLKAPRASIIGQVKVKPGDRVDQGQVLLTLHGEA